jgi:murein DD-endopeptidase MepM/ murein hydrolase activator NlpD
MNNTDTKQKINKFFKKNGYYLLIGIAMFAVVLTLILVAVTGGDGDAGVINKDDDIVDTNSSAIITYMPVLNAKIYKGYYGDELVYNETLKQWETHNAVDFQVASGSSVYAMRDGVVKDVYSNLLEGCVVVIEHDNGLVSSYGSLDANVLVEEGDVVNGGQEIGYVSTSATNETDADAHLHFGLTDNGKKIDPASYLDINVK